MDLTLFCLEYPAYRPPSCSAYVRHLASSFRLISPGIKACLCGDFDIPEIDWITATPSSADKLAVQ